MSSSRALFGLAPMLLLAFSARAADVSVTLGAGNGFAIKDNTGAVERLRVDEATGNVSRNGALFVHTTGTNNTFVGANAGTDVTAGTNNSAFGRSALYNVTAGASNSAFGTSALSTVTTGDYNSAFGTSALSSTTSDNNSAFGAFALRNATSGGNNSAFGHRALFFNFTGSNNSAFGGAALYYNNFGSSNSAFGFHALRANTSGGNNAAFGNSALDSNTTGSSNVAMGIYAGQNQTTGNNNIYLANQGAAGESGQIKIGTVGTHTLATIAGIHGTTSPSGIAVLVNASGTLGTTTSSARFKQNVRDMGQSSDVLMRLRPVTFHYREEAVGAEEAKATQYGLIAEEVAAVAPDLVAPDAEGKPYSVKYHELPALLLNELQEQHRTNAEQQQTIATQERALAEQREQIAALSSRLERIETGPPSSVR